MDKITKIEDITDESIKQISKASVYQDFIGEEIKKANDLFVAEQQKVQKTEKSLADTQKELEIVKANLQKLEQEAQISKAQALFTQRMTYFDDTYELSQKERQVVASEIKDLSEEAFANIKAKYDVLLEGKNKEIIAKNKGVTNKTAQASVDIKPGTEVADAIDKGQPANPLLPNAAAPAQTFEEKFANAFKPENCIEIRGE